MVSKETKYDERFVDVDFIEKYEHGHLKMQRNFAKKYIDKLKEKNFHLGRILDTGCAFGEMLILIGKEFENSTLTGIDISDNFIYRAKGKAIQYELDDRAKFIKADVHNIPFPDHYFDVVINTNMLHIVEDPIRMLNEIERVLSSDGIYFLADIRKSWLSILEKEIKNAYTVNELRELINKSNLRKGIEQTNLLWWKYESN